MKNEIKTFVITKKYIDTDGIIYYPQVLTNEQDIGEGRLRVEGRYILIGQDLKKKVQVKKFLFADDLQCMLGAGADWIKEVSEEHIAISTGQLYHTIEVKIVNKVWEGDKEDWWAMEQGIAFATYAEAQKVLHDMSDLPKKGKKK